MLSGPQASSLSGQYISSWETDLNSQSVKSGMRDQDVAQRPFYPSLRVVCGASFLQLHSDLHGGRK